MIKSLWNKKLSMKALSRIMTIAYVLCLIPLIWIARYSYPSHDDFSMTLVAHQTYEATGSVLAAFGACVSETIDLYITWTGYFTSSLLTSISPAVFNIHWYGIGAVLVYAGLHAGVIVFLYALLQRVFGVDKYTRRCVTIAVLVLMIQMMPQTQNRVEAFYWYSGAGNYTLTFSVLLLYLSCLLLAIYGGSVRNRGIFLFLSCPAGFFAGGANYMSALTGAILTVVFGVLLVLIRTGRMRKWIIQEASAENADAHILLRGEWRWRLLAPMIFMLAGFILNCAAPGNSVRSLQTGGYGAVKSIVLSLYYTLDILLDDYLNWAVLIVFALLAVIFWNLRAEQSRDPNACLLLTYRHPALIFIFAYGVVSANLTPLLFAIGAPGSGRNCALFWMQFILAAVLTEWYLVGWLWGKICEREGSREMTEPDLGILPKTKDGMVMPADSARVMGFLMMLFLAGSVLCIIPDPDYYTVTSAMHDLMNGTAQAYAGENEERMAILENSASEDVELTQLKNHPALLFYSDISIGDSGWDNFTMNRYFGTNSIIGIEPDADSDAEGSDG